MPSRRVSLRGKGADLFFGDYAPPNQAEAMPPNDATVLLSPVSEDAPRSETPPAEDREVGQADKVSAAEQHSSRPRRSRRRATAASNGAKNSASTSDSTLAITSSSASAQTIDAIRKVVKTPGREVSFVRLTAEEKAQLGDLVYTFKRQGQKTTENEINRIALNYLLHDFHEHGERSVLARVLAALLA
ncbi:MAG: hypothetical protein M3R02_13015 [Chloroflexota bacterium]|nr:hypothetical protein [Chloroflexota bacterium]